MCLIITGNAAKVRSTLLTTPGLLADIFENNKDGIGSMYASDDGMVVANKSVPQTLEEATAFIEQLPNADRDLALHFRMRTHGDIDLTNCHPYPIIDGHVHMMHNGVIHTVDDSSDKTKSDTWHYIDKVLKPQLELAPSLLAIPGWQRLVAEDIGNSNRFVLLDRDGRMVILNKRTGVEHDGMWFSNTYAWSPEILIPEYRGWSGRGYYTGGWGGWGANDDDDNYTAWWKSRAGGGTATTSTASPYPVSRVLPVVSDEEVWEAIHEADADAMFKLLDQYPVSTMSVLYKTDKFVCSVELDELSQQDAKVVTMLQEGNVQTLVRYCNKSTGRCRKVAEIAAWYGAWVAKEDPKDDGSLTVQDEPELQVIDGQVVRIKDHVQEENPDDADLETWRAEFQNWMQRQNQPLTGPRQQPAKWTAQTPALFAPTEIAQVAQIKSRTIMYRGYRVEVPAEMFERGNVEKLREHLDTEADRMHAEDLAARKEQEAQTTPLEPVFSQPKDEAHVGNEAYAG